MLWLSVIVVVLVMSALAVWAMGQSSGGVDPRTVRDHKYKTQGRGEYYGPQ